MMGVGVLLTLFGVLAGAWGLSIGTGVNGITNLSLLHMQSVVLMGASVLFLAGIMCICAAEIISAIQRRTVAEEASSKARAARVEPSIR